MDKQRLGQKKKGNRNQQGSNKGRGGKRPGFVTKNRFGGNVAKNRFVGNTGPKGKGSRRSNIGKCGDIVRVDSSLFCISGSGQGSGGGIKTKTTTITRTVNDLRQLIRPKTGEKAKTPGTKVTVQKKKSSIKKRLGLQSKSARAATLQARRNVMALRIDWSDDHSSNSLSSNSLLPSNPLPSNPLSSSPSSGDNDASDPDGSSSW